MGADRKDDHKQAHAAVGQYAGDQSQNQKYVFGAEPVDQLVADSGSTAGFFHKFRVKRGEDKNQKITGICARIAGDIHGGVAGPYIQAVGQDRHQAGQQCQR